MRVKWLDPGLTFLFLGSFAVFTNLHMAFIAVPLYVLELGGSAWAAAWQNTLLAGSAVFFRFLLVPWVDRYGRRFCLLLSGAALVVAPLLILATGSLVFLTLVRVLQGLGLALYPLAANTLIADLSPQERRGTALGLMRLVIITALVTGPPAASFIIDGYGFQVLFFGLGVFGLVGMTPLLAIRERAYVRVEAPAFSGIRAALNVRPLQVLFASTTACGLAYGVLLTFLPLYAVEIGIGNFGLFFTVFALSGLTAGVIAGRLSDTVGRKAVLVPGLLLFGAGIGYLNLLAPGAALVLAGMATGVAYSATLTVLVAWVVDEAGRELRAASLGLFENGIDVGITLGSFAFGSVIALAGYGAGFSATGLLLLLFAGMVAGLGRVMAPSPR